MLSVGDPAPDFEAPTQDGSKLRLSSLRGAPVVLYFYPEADTSGCTIESKGFRDIYPELTSKKIHVVGVSTDEIPEQLAFAKKYQLPFPLVADSSKAVARSYDVLRASGRARRVTFLLDAHGKVVEIIDNPSAEVHVDRAKARYLGS